MYTKILAAFDGSEGSKAAFARACTVAQEYNASLTMVWVCDTLPHLVETAGEVEEEQEAGEEWFRKLREYAEKTAAEKNLTVTSVLLRGNASREVVKYAEANGFDLIVIGQVGHSGFIGRVLGPTADRISETAHCDVLIVRRPDRKK